MVVGRLSGVCGQRQPQLKPRLRMWWSQSTIIIRRDHVLNHKFTIADNHMINKQSNNFLLE
jgi:hypothetical protein